MRKIEIESILMADEIEFTDSNGKVTATVDMPPRKKLGSVLLANGVHPDDVARQVTNLKKQLAFDRKQERENQNGY